MSDMYALASAQQSEKVSPTNILRHLQSHDAVMILGPGGVGKTYAIRKLCIHLRQLQNQSLQVKDRKEYDFAIVAPTGVAAVNLLDEEMAEHKIFPRTIHSWAGVGFAEYKTDELIRRVRQSKAKGNWIHCDILVFDEISMCGGNFFTKLDKIAKAIRKNDKPFGGIKLVLTGDFLQLPPVKDVYLYHSPAFQALNIRCLNMHVPHRFTDTDHHEFLMRIRQGELNKTDKLKLQARAKSYKDFLAYCEAHPKRVKRMIKPTILFPRRIDVDSYNNTELQKLDGAVQLYKADDDKQEMKKEEIEILRDDSADLGDSWKMGDVEDMIEERLDRMIPKILRLKKGAQVMLRVNLDVDSGLVNGSRGVVVKAEEDEVIVKFVNGVRLPIAKAEFKMRIGKHRYMRLQYPLILAWATTIHKSQGLTLDLVSMDLQNVFQAGQAYVSLSRARNLMSIYIIHLRFSSITADDNAVAYMQDMLQKELEQDMNEG